MNTQWPSSHIPFFTNITASLYFGLILCYYLQNPIYNIKQFVLVGYLISQQAAKIIFLNLFL